MKRIAGNAIAILCVLGMLTSCATYSTLESVSTPCNNVYGEDGNSMQVVEDGKFLISAEGLSIEDGVGTVILSIGNKGDLDYRFNDDSVEFFGGNYDEGTWMSLGKWSSGEYHDYMVRSASTEGAAPLFAFMVGMGMVGNMLDAYAGDGSIDWGDAFFNTMLISAALNSGYEEDYYTISSVEDSLLHTKTICSREVYRGLVAFKAGEFPDYMIRLHLDSGRPYELVFQRNDRESYL